MHVSTGTMFTDLPAAYEKVPGESRFYLGILEQTLENSLSYPTFDA